MIEVRIEGYICGMLWWPTGAMAAIPTRRQLRLTAAATALERPCFDDILREILLDGSRDFDGGGMFTVDTLIIVESEQFSNGRRVLREHYHPITKFPSIRCMVDVETCGFDLCNSILAEA